MKKRLKFLELYLISLKEKKARKIEFDLNRNLIVGGSGKIDNDVGKSTIVKNLYYSLGADVSFEPRWLDAKPTSILKFEYENKVFYILRNKRSISLFNEEMEIIKKFKSIGKELSPYFSKMFNFNLDLTSSKGTISIAPPVFSFLPFYLDQDKGWNEVFSSFEKLGQFPKNDWKNKIIDFHTGIRTSEYYTLASEKRKISLERKEEEKELDFLRIMKTKVTGKFGSLEIGINPEDFKEEIENLMEEINYLKGELSEDKQKLVILHNKKCLKEEEVRIVSLSLKESEKDLEFVTKELVKEEINCPLCGTIHNNGFRERFSLELDKEELQELLIELGEELNNIEKDLEEIKIKLSPKEERFEKLESILNMKKGEVKLSELIKNEGKINLLSSLKEEITAQESKVENLRTREKELEKRMKDISNVEKKKKVLKDYQFTIDNYLEELGVELKFEDYKNIYGVVKLGGSRKTRALLAYFYTFINLVEKGTTSTIFPIVIDSPHQQDPGDEMKTDILNFIKKHTPKETQLIMSLVDPKDIDFGGKKIILNKKLELLNQEDYKETYILFDKLLKQINDVDGNNSSNI